MANNLSALIARLEDAEVVTHALEVEFAAFIYANGATFAGVVSYDPELWSERNASPLSSLDAALALAERVLPGWQIGMWTTKQNAVGSVLREDGGAFDATSSTPALALCIAVLRAKQGEGG